MKIIVGVDRRAEAILSCIFKAFAQTAFKKKRKRSSADTDPLYLALSEAPNIINFLLFLSDYILLTPLKLRTRAASRNHLAENPLFLYGFRQGLRIRIA